MRLGAFWSRGAHWGHFWLRDGLRDGLHVLVIYHLLKKRRASFWYFGVKISGGGLKTMTSGFGGKNLRTSRANFEGLRAISECGTVFYRACGTKKLSLPVLGELPE